MLLFSTKNKTSLDMYAGWNSQPGDVIQFESLLSGGNWSLHATVPGRTPLSLGPYPNNYKMPNATVEFSGDLTSCSSLPASGILTVGVTFSKQGPSETGWALTQQVTGQVNCNVHVSNATSTDVVFNWNLS